jgi:hypothetical protein
VRRWRLDWLAGAGGFETLHRERDPIPYAFKGRIRFADFGYRLRLLFEVRHNNLLGVFLWTLGGCGGSA